ncbi:hypothetical protein FQA47_006102 [Oryzias melastigma]|uniref:Uncharacterized protein n=1 Tax=Oryzias melastigma TaxID=30732 RepID=A0A834BVG6_ORYME|nr:hypothetical protein FQA47_006102 [Oryzias melastigma]
MNGRAGMRPSPHARLPVCSALLHRAAAGCAQSGCRLRVLPRRASGEGGARGPPHSALSCLAGSVLTKAFIKERGDSLKGTSPRRQTLTERRTEVCSGHGGAVLDPGRSRFPGR